MENAGRRGKVLGTTAYFAIFFMPRGFPPRQKSRAHDAFQRNSLTRVGRLSLLKWLRDCQSGESHRPKSDRRRRMSLGRSTTNRARLKIRQALTPSTDFVLEKISWRV